MFVYSCAQQTFPGPAQWTISVGACLTTCICAEGWDASRYIVNVVYNVYTAEILTIITHEHVHTCSGKRVTWLLSDGLYYCTYFQVKINLPLYLYKILPNGMEKLLVGSTGSMVYVQWTNMDKWTSSWRINPRLLEGESKHPDQVSTIASKSVFLWIDMRPRRTTKK